MTTEQLFSVLNLVAAISWLLLALLPRQRWIARTVTGAIVPTVLAIAYVLLLTRWSGAGGFATLADVARLFSDPWLLLAGWVHYLAFDLLIGSWIVQDAQERGMTHWLVLPCLLLTFMFGPAGWLLYQGMRRVPRLG